MSDLGQRWKHDKVERARLETEAPIIMKFDNGWKWVRLDSKAEMEREGNMMQNCISGYCPVGEEIDKTFGLRAEFTDQYELDEQTDDTVYEFLENWIEDIKREYKKELEEIKASREASKGRTFSLNIEKEIEEYSPIHAHLIDNLENANPAELDLTSVLEKSNDEILDWMANQIMNADADIETGAPPGGHLVYSLRDKNGESHISAEYDPLDVDMRLPILITQTIN
jgi:hypothetical protein